MMELADVRDSKSRAARRKGSSPFAPTIFDNAMDSIPRFSEFIKLCEGRGDSCFWSYTGKGWINGMYVGAHCKWRDDADAFSGFARPRAVDLPDVDVPKSKSQAYAEIKNAAKAAGAVDVPGFETVVVGKNGLAHGVRFYSNNARPGPGERLNYRAALVITDVLRGAVPRQFRPADESDRGKPVKGIVVLEGAVRDGGETMPVRITVFASAVCDFGRDSDWEDRELYTLHSVQVLNPGADVLDF